MNPVVDQDQISNINAINNSKSHPLGKICSLRIGDVERLRGAACCVSISKNPSEDVLGQFVGLYQKDGESYVVVGEDAILRKSIIKQGLRIDRARKFEPEHGYLVSPILSGSRLEEGAGYDVANVDLLVKDRLDLAPIYIPNPDEVNLLRASFPDIVRQERAVEIYAELQAYASRSPEDKFIREVDCNFGRIQVSNVHFLQDPSFVVFTKTNASIVQVPIDKITKIVVLPESIDD